MAIEHLSLIMKLLCQVFFTLAVISFLYRDNPIYKFAEHFFVGIAAGYWIVLQFHTVFMPKLWEPFVHKGLMGGTLDGGEHRLAVFLLIVPGILGFLMFTQFSKNSSWIARWPMATVIGSFSGLAIIGFAQGDLVPQVQANLLPIFKPGSWTAFISAPAFSQQQLFAFLDFIAYPILIVGVFSSLVYFFFSKEHRGATGATATIGIWFLMVSFGASYGRTVATRVSLFLERSTFLLIGKTPLGDWELEHKWVTAAVTVLIIGFLVVYFGVLRRGRETEA
jgi:hypothetical protein